MIGVYAALHNTSRDQSPGMLFSLQLAVTWNIYACVANVSCGDWVVVRVDNVS